MNIILPPIFMTLFAGWMLWGWCVGESKKIPWMRHWCAPLFVITTMLLSFGTGGFVARKISRENARTEIRKVLTAIEQNLERGNTNLVLQELRELDQTDNPDASEFELLSHLPKMSSSLHYEDRVSIAEDDSGTGERL